MPQLRKRRRAGSEASDIILPPTSSTPDAPEDDFFYRLRAHPLAGVARLSPVPNDLDTSLLHRHYDRILVRDQCLSPDRYIPRPIRTWSAQEISLWAERREWHHPDPLRWRYNWKDDAVAANVSEGKLAKQLTRWAVPCPMCLLYRDPSARDHLLASCHRPEARQARSTRARLWEKAVDLQANGIKGYGLVPWCAECCLPRSCCPAWETQDEDDPASIWGPRPRVWGGGDVYACRSHLAKAWSRRPGARCVFPEVVINAIAAMSAFPLAADTFGCQIAAWQQRSTTRFNQTWGVDGWLLSPMPWGRQDVMVMLRVFSQLDVVVEDLWIEGEVARRCAKLGLRENTPGDTVGSPLPYDDTATVGNIGEGERLLTLRACLEDSEAAAERAYGCMGDSSFLDPLGVRTRAWRRGGIRCQLCMAYGWNEDCYLHDITDCSMHRESRSTIALLGTWSGMRGAEGGEGLQCPQCRFPAVVCWFRYYEHGSDDGPYTCSLAEEEGNGSSGVEVVCRTVATLLSIADGIIGDLVIEEESAGWRNKGVQEYEPLSQGWMETQVRIGDVTVPRIVRVFQRLLDVFPTLQNIGWEGFNRS